MAALRWIRAAVCALSGTLVLADLRGRSIGTPDPRALSTMLGEEDLRLAGLVPGRDVQLNRCTPAGPVLAVTV